MFHWQMVDYEVFQPKCHMLQIHEMEPEDGYPRCYKEHMEGTTSIDDTPTHTFHKEKRIEYEAKLEKLNLGEKD